ncbi:DUF2332 family protein [Sulfitobacter sp. M57]|uniref:DUF2332 domain-containing protein n=1 Tax=unclassified Sulfitobacter TaxID=196795 RepID=UPI0023E27C04|nr:MULTISPECIES: DUF2332 family protein [unclassified Sulfitobacter]MDF3412906.1 DUF2332 family protein [Sulfitobacter sp. KE5]MDF3421810.1 DUF2332 family protein [Sulfitobacter sp. KE43]MDF3431455.1 DUF2332 family protein [Sulfitobacter sp. KE42]MDF3457096.1 DUF2332 family protein [Sulfitobacter sp. S74]MDF3460999.1 DUF2332 family protein [Sulfitobacter sp. Ks18]
MSLPDAFAAQADTCTRMGSPFMGQLLSLLAADWPADSALGRKFAAFNGDIGPAGHSLPLRIAGGLHALVLSNAAPELAALYPPHSATDDALRAGVLAALRTHEDFLLEWTESPPQTNEVRRSAALIAGAHVALQHFDLPIHLSELGASGGLNLLWDQYALEVGGARFGAHKPAVVLSPDWTGAPPPTARPVIVDRAGVDLNPLDPTHPDHLLRLTAYLWADQPERLAMTRAAASRAKTPPQKGDAIDWLAPRLADAPQGRLHLIQHTVAWQYFPEEVQARGTALIEAAGAQATSQRPLAWLSMETDGDTTGKIGAALTLRLWPGDLTYDLGRADFHGRWVNWAHTG